MKKLLFSIIMVFALSISAWAQNRTINGVVTGDDDKPIPGVTVLVKGAKSGAITDIDGKYQVSIPENATTLVFSFVGMETKEVPIGTDASINVKLSKSTKKIDEVVVTALGVEKKQKALGYAQQSVTGDQLVESGEQNVVNTLNSKVAGLQITSSGGTPGASSKIIVRGPSTITNDNQPLFVVDGVPIDNNTNATVAGDYPYNINLEGVNYSNRAIDINPDDIASITVLKGPSAAALYGVRAGNGAIIITTKRGNFKGNGKLAVSISSSVQFDQVNKLPKLQHTYAQGFGSGQYNTDSSGNVIPGQFYPGDFEEGNPGLDGVFETGDSLEDPGTSSSWGPKISSLSGRKAYDHYKEFFRTGVSYNNSISIAGGTDRSSARLSFENLRQNGVIHNTDFARTSVRLTTDTKITDRWTLGATANYINSGGKRAQNGSNLAGVMLALTRAPASYDLIGTTDPSAHNDYEYSNGNQRQYFEAYDNPFWSVYNNISQDNVNRILGNAITSYKFTDWLDASYRLGGDVYTDQRKQYYAIGSQQPAQGPTGQIEEDIQRSMELYGDLLINLHHTWKKDFTTALTLGNNFDHQYFQDVYARGRNLSVPDFYNLNNASDRYSNEMHSNLKTTALFFDLNADWKSIVFLEVTGRNEWASTFGNKKNNFFYPSANVSFVFSELIKQNKYFSFGKVRASIAQVGINPPVYSSTTSLAVPNVSDGYSSGSISFPYLGQNGYGYTYNLVLGNPSIKPERKIGYEGGLDIRFFEGRLTVDFTAYYEKTKDIILARPIAPSSGFNAVTDNTGAMRNQGIEMVIGADLVKMKDNGFRWNITANLSRNRNQVLELAEGITEYNIENGFNDIGSYAIVGQPYGVFYGTKWSRTADGSLLIDSTTGLPEVDTARGRIGDPNPKFLAGLRNTFSYKGLSISVLFDFRNGGDIWGGTIARLNRLGASEASADRERSYLIDGEVQTGIDGNGNPTYRQNTTQVDGFDYFYTYKGDGGNYATENAIFDGSWVRLREVTISYHFDLKKAKVLKSFDVAATGRNLWLHTKYPGVDPETSLTGAGSNIGGYDYFNNPSTRSYILSLKLNF